METKTKFVIAFCVVALFVGFSSSHAQWVPDGVAISVASYNQYEPQLISDGAGGAIITWYDYRNGTDTDIYAQRVDASGVVQWAAGGVPICAASDHQSCLRVATDGAGGAIITWHDNRSGTDTDIYAQRVDAGGTVQWAGNGVAICTATGDQGSQS